MAVINAGPRPDGWIGKSWACYQGYLRATAISFVYGRGHNSFSVRVVIGSRTSGQSNLDALTAMPRLICEDFGRR